MIDITVDVSVFSAHPYEITLWLNRGRVVKVPGVDLNWQPTSPTSKFGFDNGGPSANCFGPGANTMQIQVGTASIYQQQITLTVGNPIALQLYLFADATSGSRLHYVLLNAGNVIDTDIAAAPPPT